MLPPFVGSTWSIVNWFSC